MRWPEFDAEPGTRNAHPVDLHVGAMMRAYRRAAGLTQQALAVAADVSFQQIQRYETGASRISASALHEVAAVLGIPVERFFSGLDAADSDLQAGSERGVRAFLMTGEGLEIAQAFPKIRGSAVRRRILDLVRSLSEA